MNDLELLQQGSPEAFERLYHQYGGKLYGFIFKLSSGDSYVSEEIVQRTFLKIWENHSGINTVKSFNTYLGTIAKNMLLNDYEHRLVEYVYKDYMLKHYSSADDLTEKEVDKNLLEEFIDSLIEKLPPARKQVFILSRKQMLSNKEIAERLGISESTVQTQLRKAVIFLKEELSKYYEQLLSLLLISFFVN